MTISKEVRAQIRKWLKAQIEGQDQIQMDDLIEEALEHFSQDKKFMNDLASTAIPFLIRLQAQDVLRVGRRTIDFHGISPIADAKKRVASKPWKFDNWTEHVGNQLHVKLLRMTGPDLDHAIAFRQSHGQDQLNKAEFLSILRERVEKGQTVEDAWTREEIEIAYEKVFTE